VELDREVGESISRAKGKVYKKTSVSSTRLRQKMRMEVDALYYVTGSILFMECEDRRWRPVAFLSKFLNEIERNYEIYNKEMLAVIRGLENWRHLLEDAKFKFEV